MSGSSVAWFWLGWMCVWPIIAVTFFVLWLRKVRPPKRRLAWVDNTQEDDPDE